MSGPTKPELEAELRELDEEKDHLAAENEKLRRELEEIRAAAASQAGADLNDLLDESEAGREALAEKILELEEQVAEYKPFIEVPLARSIEDIIEQVGDAHLREIAEQQLGKEDMERVKVGRRPMWDESPEKFEEAVAERVRTLARELIARQTKWTKGVESGEHAQLRTCKMVMPKRECQICDKKLCYEHGNQVQIPVEEQINNGAASLADPIIRYQRKGAKLLSPVRCRLIDCWLPQAVEFGTPVFGGYCSELHRRHMEGRIEHRGPITA